MEDLGLVRCDSLDTGSDGEVLTLMERLSFDPLARDASLNLDPSATPDPPSLEPSPAELAQCEAEVGTLLSIIAELNKKMGSLQAPQSDPGEVKPRAPSRPLVPDLLSHRLNRSPDRIDASPAPKPPLTRRGGGGVVWSKLQEVLSSVEDSISCKRSWAAPIMATDRDKQQEHLYKAQESWGKATKILDDMEREFGITCPTGHYQQDVLVLERERGDSDLRTPAHRHTHGDLERAHSNIIQMEEDKNKLVCLQKAWRSGSLSPSSRPSLGPFGSDWASPSFPGSPLLHKRRSRAVTPLSLGGEGSPLGSVNSVSPCPSPIGLESETERLNRVIDRLKARNERLTAALERRKGESELITLALHRLEADCNALHNALTYCEECEEAYAELLSLCDSRKQKDIPLQTDSADADGELETEELSTSFSTAGVREEPDTHTHTGQSAPEPVEREEFLRRKIERLKMDRAAICLPKPIPKPESKMSCEPRGGPGWKDHVKPSDGKKEKNSLFYELISVREEMSDLRSHIRLKEKELRCLEWSLVAQKSQEAGGGFVPESLREETEGWTGQQQRLCLNVAKLGSEVDMAGPRTRPILKELQAVLQREQALKKRLALVHDSLNTALTDSGANRRDNGEQLARLTQAHSKALSSYRQIRRKYREQVWRLEQRVAAAMTEGQQRSASPNTAGESLEWRREETVL